MTQPALPFDDSDLQPVSRCASCSWGHAWRRATDGARGVACLLFKAAPCEGMERERAARGR